MSKRIDELWGQALDRAVPDTYSSLTWTQVEKIKAVFAELIVREAMTVTKTFTSNQGLDYSAPVALARHFGVEE